MTPLETIKIIYHFFSLSPTAWARGAMARDLQNNSVDPRSPEAVSWSLYGAMFKFADIGFQNPIRKLLLEQVSIQCDIKFMGLSVVLGLSDFNDHPQTTYADLLNLLNRAILNLENHHG